MTWIRTTPFAEASPALRTAMEAQRALYPAEYSKPVTAAEDGQSAAIVAAHSLIPPALHHAFSTFGALMAPELPLTRIQHEMVATVVSAANRCRLCSKAHAATRIGKEHHERLRANGFDDTGILQITLIASWFNYINRVADALGVGQDYFSE